MIYSEAMIALMQWMFAGTTALVLLCIAVGWFVNYMEQKKVA